MNVIAMLLSGIAIVASIIMGVVTLVASKNIAKKYGDLAGSQAAIDYEERKAAEARTTTLRALRNEVARIRKLGEANSQIRNDGLGMARMPTTAFETAFVSEPSGLSVDPELLDAVVDYLARADAINSRIDTYLGLGAALGQSNYAAEIMSDAAQQTRDKSKEILEILGKLDALLERESKINSVCDSAAV